METIFRENHRNVRGRHEGMNREEFLRRLEAMLDGISQGEKSEAMQYYNDYFEDAGVENEQEVMESLESPEKVAKTIKAGLDEKAADLENETENSGGNNGHSVPYVNGNYNNTQSGSTQNGTTQSGSTQSASKQSGNSTNENVGNGYSTGAGTYNTDTAQIKKETSPWKIVAIVLLCIVLSPIILPMAGGFFGIICGIIAILFGIIVSFGAIGIALIIAGVITFGFGIVKLFIAPAAGILIIGCSLIIVAIGLLFMLVTVWLCGWLLPVIIKGIVNLCKLPFKQKGAYAA